MKKTIDLMKTRLKALICFLLLDGFNNLEPGVIHPPRASPITTQVWEVWMSTCYNVSFFWLEKYMKYFITKDISIKNIFFHVEIF